MRHNSTKQKGKKFQFHIIDQSFQHNGMGISYQKKLESLEGKKAVPTSRKHGVRTICNFISNEDRPENSRDVTPFTTKLIFRAKTVIRFKTQPNTALSLPLNFEKI